MAQDLPGRRSRDAPPGTLRSRRPVVDPEALALHGSLLDDRSRTDAYLTVLRAVVRPGDVVVDLGSGTGVFGVAAAQAGAARVYAIEASPMAQLVQRVAAANGVQDRITVIRRWSRRVRLPERADVIVSELVGNEPFAEGILITTSDAVRRFLKPGGRLVPDELTVLATPMQLTREARRSAVLGDERIRRWQQWYGIDFSALPDGIPAGPSMAFVNPWQARQWTPLGPATVVQDVALAGHPVLGARQVPLPLDRAGRLDAVLIHFELGCDGRTFLSTAADQVDEQNHWQSPVRYLHRPKVVGPTSALAVRYLPRAYGGSGACAVLQRSGGGPWSPLP